MSGHHHYRVNTRGNRRHDGIVYSPYYTPPVKWAKCCVDNAVGLDGQRRCRCAWQPEVQSKVDVLSAPPATAAEAAVQAEHRLNLARFRETDRQNGYENRLPVLNYNGSPIRYVSN